MYIEGSQAIISQIIVTVFVSRQSMSGWSIVYIEGPKVIISQIIVLFRDNRFCLSK